MDSRQRILETINHKEPDRVPVDLGSTPCTGISAIAYHNLKQYLGIFKGHTRVYDLGQQLAQPEDFILERFKVDALDIGRTFNTKVEDWYDIHVNGIDMQWPKWFQPRHNSDDSYDVLHRDGTVLSRMTKDALVFDQTYYPCLDHYPENYEDFQKIIRKSAWAAMPVPPFSNIGEKKFWKRLRQNTITLKEHSKKAIVLNYGSTSFEFGNSFLRMDKQLIDIRRNPSKVERLLDYIQEFSLNSLKVICGYVGDVIDIIRIGDDLGENNGPFFSPQIYRKMFKPKHSEICDFIKTHSSMKIMFHTCGSITQILPDLIETGIDILNPVQINARDMDPKFLKDNFGDDITFWGGGADTRNVINRKTTEEVKAHILELLEIFGPGGGYVWNTVHNILPDVPPQNIVAMFEAIDQFNNN
ncbi:MAG: uroporphyrinogen decarboxylase family protein [Candidatus Thorarchaeota archaeon]